MSDQSTTPAAWTPSQRQRDTMVNLATQNGFKSWEEVLDHYRKERGGEVNERTLFDELMRQGRAAAGDAAHARAMKNLEAAKAQVERDSLLPMTNAQATWLQEFVVAWENLDKTDLPEKRIANGDNFVQEIEDAMFANTTLGEAKSLVTRSIRAAGVLNLQVREMREDEATDVEVEIASSLPGGQVVTTTEESNDF